MAVDCESAFTRRESFKRVAAFLIAAPAVLSPAASHAEPALMEAAPLKSSPMEAAVGGAAIMPAEGVFCDQAVSRLVNAETRQEVYIVGTAHISQLSAELVRDTIRLVHPDRVMIELDSQRIKKRAPASNAASESNSQERSQPSSVWGLIKAEWGKPVNIGEKLANVEAGVIGLAISSLYQKLDKMGFSSGQEFVTAMREADAAGAKLVLGDRPVYETLKRLQQSIAKTGLNDVMAFANGQAESPEEKLLASQMESEASSLDAAQLASTVETLKERKNVRKIMASLNEALPAVYQALIGERDVYMANSILRASGQMTVAVVGIAHMDGIERTLAAEGFALARPEVACTPESASS